MDTKIFSAFLVVVTALAPLLVGCGANGVQGEPELDTIEQKVSYSIGLNIGADFAAQGVEIDSGLLARGIEDAFHQREPLLSEAEMHDAILAFQEEMMIRQEELMGEQAEKNLREGQEFLAENARQDDVITLDSGLQYRVLEEGEGATPTEADIVAVHYEGRLVDGTVFDSSWQRGQPAEFPVIGVIPGWTEALLMMQEGDKWEIFLPSDLAYGEQGAPPAIGPNATLIFEVELLTVNP